MGNQLGYAGPVTATIPATGNVNAGNWTVNFTPDIIGISLAEFECYRIVISGGPPGSKFNVFIGTGPWDTVFPGWDTSWDPNQAMPLLQSQTVSLQWNTGNVTTNGAPQATLWFREVSPL